MNVEENRLRSFESWADNSPADTAQLAREGFFATGFFLEAECFWCHKRSCDWQPGENIRERHMLLDPRCAFLTAPHMCGNVPLNAASAEPLMQSLSTTQSNAMPVLEAAAGDTPTTTTAATAAAGETATQQEICTRDAPQLDMKIEANRLASFQNWPNPNITPQALAKAGFFYLNRSDQVECAWCGGVMERWEKEDNAFYEHQRFFPDCPRVQLGPLIEIASDGIRDLGIQQISPPKQPKYSSLDARLRTYINWPIPNVQKPEALAQAGLYFQGIGDHVRCFHCHIGLRSWQREDDPWFEHAKWYPQCQFVRLVKGPAYVEEVRKLTIESVQQSEVANGINMSSTARRDQQPAQSNPDARSSHAQPCIATAMFSRPVLQALEMGLDVGSVRTVTARKLELTGRPYDTVENLIKAVFGEHESDEEEEESANEREYACIAGWLEREISNLQAQEMQNISGDPSNAATTSASAVAALVTPIVNLPPESGGADIPPATAPAAQHMNTVSLPESDNLRNHATENMPSTSAVARTVVAASEENKEDSQNRSSSEQSRSVSLEEENRQLKDARLCKVCLDEEVGIVFLPCGHLVTCVQCAPGVNQCPLCRSAIKGFVRTFLA